VRRNRDVLSICLVLFALSFASSARAESYLCDIKQFLTLREEGTLNKDRMSEQQAKLYSRIGWNTLTGDLRFYNRDGGSTSYPIELKLIQKASNENSAVGVSIVHGSAAIVLTTMTVNTWRKGMPFLLHRHSETYSGNCVRL